MDKPKLYILDQDSEADTCRKEVTPKLKNAGWSDDQLLEQRAFTAGKIVIIGRVPSRNKKKVADYILRYSTNFPIAVVEAKKRYRKAADGMPQAKEYAQILGLQFAYATNGAEILEYDFATGLEHKISAFPSPDALWQRLHPSETVAPEAKEMLLKPFKPIAGREIRYYQTNAVNRATEAILAGRKRALLTLATGTGKTTVAFLLIYKLWQNRWNRRGDNYKPKVLFLADRDVLASEPHNKEFAIFGDARCLISEVGVQTSRDIFFSTYQSLAEDSSRTGAFRKFPRDFFDLIVIDECHRGSASDDSNWRVILDYFTYAVQLGLTATPLREDNRDTYGYFGNPLYTYSLKQGIDDGFLAPYMVHRVVTDIDATGYRPQVGERDANGKLIPDEEYHTPDFENSLSHLPRTKAVARHLTKHLQKHGRFDKTIVFCANQSHASDFQREFGNLNADLMRKYHTYCVRITSDEGDVGKGHLAQFMDVDTNTPTVVVTSRLLSTGVDVPTCRNVVIVREVSSMTEFKQIMGRGTRVREDKKKLFFTILDYTGSATRKFADSDFDGEPPFVTEETINSSGDELVHDVPPPPVVNENPPGSPVIQTQREQFRVEKGDVKIAAETVLILDERGKLRTVEYRRETIRQEISVMFTSADEFRSHWAEETERARITEALAEKGISLSDLANITNQPDADPFDLLCLVAFDQKPLTRRQRADKLRQNRPDVLAQYGAKARDVLDMILEKYVDFGPDQLQPSVISVSPITKKGNSLEIVRLFGGMDHLRIALNNVTNQLYAA